MRPRPRNIAALLATLVPAFACAAEEEPVGELPHVLVVTIDTLRADHLGCYGYFRETSPFLDRIAEESLVFDWLLAPVSQTLPSHMSLFTGLAPHEHGALANVHQGKTYDRAPGAVTVAQALREVGYETAGYVAAAPLARGTGIEAGFDRWWEREGKPVRADVMVDRALEGLRGPTSGPTFTWLHLFDVHAPYEAPEGYAGRFRGVAAEAQARRLEQVGVLRADAPDTNGESPTTSLDHDEYDAEIRFVDDQLRRLWAGLEELGLAEELLLVVTSDHGEGLWQHGSKAHGTLWLETLHVPLIVRVPGSEPGRVETPLEMRDVLPTALALDPRLGSVLADWLATRTGRDALAPGAEAEPLLSQLPMRRRGMAYALQEGDWRLIATEPYTRGLYDLAADPHELRSVHEREPERVERMRSTLEALVEEQEARGESLGAAGARPMEAGRVRALEELGYGGADEDDDGDGDGESGD